MYSREMQKEWLDNYIKNVFQECDRGTWEHSLRVGKMCQKIAQALDLSQREISYITMAGLLHDVGKVFMPETVNHPGKLADQDRYMINFHPQLGTRFLRINWFGLPEQIQEGISLHHERLTGSGYPFKLKGVDIPLTARIVAVADVFDAMSTCRPYRPALPQREIFHELYNPGYDQRIVRVLMDTK